MRYGNDLRDAPALLKLVKSRGFSVCLQLPRDVVEIRRLFPGSAPCVGFDGVRRVRNTLPEPEDLLRDYF